MVRTEAEGKVTGELDKTGETITLASGELAAVRVTEPEAT
jgi:hypothetical protein